MTGALRRFGEPDHLSRAVVAAIVVFAFTGRLAWYVGTIVVVHALSSALSIIAMRRNRQSHGESTNGERNTKRKERGA
jgi:hypothetical protein